MDLAKLATPAPRNVTIVSEMHCGRTLGGVETSDWQVVRQAVARGCDLQEARFVLRHPEVMLCDLSNPDEQLSSCSPREIERFYEVVDQTLQSGLLPEGMRRISGNGLDPEIAISGPTKSDLILYRDRLLAEVRREFGIEQLVVPSEDARGLHRNTLLRKADAQAQSIYSHFCAFYGQFIDPGAWSTSSALNVRQIYSRHSVWRQLEALAENKLFVVSAGLAIGLGYVHTTRDNRVYFAEVHRQNDPSLLQKHASFDGVFPAPLRDSSSWLVIDKAYTGGSIHLAASRLRHHVGPSASIKTVALFPKSLGAVLSCDFVVYAGRVIDVQTVKSRLTPKSWHIELLHAGTATCS